MQVLQIILLVVLFLILLVLIGGCAFLMGLGKAVGAGGNLSNVLSNLTDAKIKDGLKAEDAEQERKPPNQILRTIGGVLFGVSMLLIPLLYGERRNGTPYISIDHHFRLYLVVLLVVCVVMVFIAMWISELKTK